MNVEYYFITGEEAEFLNELIRLRNMYAILENNLPLLQDFIIGSMSDDELSEFLSEFDLSQESSSPTTITETQFNTYRTMKYSQLPQSMIIYDTCPISVDKFESDDNIVILPCGHYYLYDSIHQWLTKYSDYCPYCKKRCGD